MSDKDTSSGSSGDGQGEVVKIEGAVNAGGEEEAGVANSDAGGSQTDGPGDRPFKIDPTILILQGYFY